MNKSWFLLIAERVRRDNDRLRDQLRQVENTIRTEESSRSRMKEDMNVARRNLDQAREEMRRLETSQRGMYNQALGKCKVRFFLLFFSEWD